MQQDEKYKMLLQFVRDICFDSLNMPGDCKKDGRAKCEMLRIHGTALLAHIGEYDVVPLAEKYDTVLKALQAIAKIYRDNSYVKLARNALAAIGETYGIEQTEEIRECL